MTGILAVIFPAQTMLFSAFGWRGAGSPFGFFLFAWLMMLSGFAIPIIAKRKITPYFNYRETGRRKKDVTGKIFAIISILLPSVTAALILNGADAYVAAIIGITAALTGLRGFYREYYDIFNQAWIFYGILVLLVSAAATVVFDGSLIYGAIVPVCAAVFITIAAIVLNQNNLDGAIKSVAGGIGGQLRLRAYNIFVVVVILVIAAILANAGFIAGALKTLCDSLAGLPALLIYLAGLLFGKGREVKEIPGTGGGDIGVANGLPVGSDDRINIIVAALFFIILIVFLVRRYRPGWLKRLAYRIKKLILRVKTGLNNILSGYFFVVSENTAEYYIDEITGMERHAGKADKEAGKGKISGRWRFKGGGSKGRFDPAVLNEIKDPVMKARYIFSVIVMLIIDEGINVKKSDTVGEICLKAPFQMKEQVAAIFGIASLYESARYGGISPCADEIKAAAETCSALEKTIYTTAENGEPQ